MSELLDFTVYHLLHEFDPENKGFMPRARFYKALYLLDDRLKKRKIDIALPWCWYKFGPQVQERFITSSVFRLSASSPDLNEKYKVYFGKEPRTKGLPEKETAAIMNEIRKMNKEHLSTDKMVELVYAKAPRKMLRTFKELEDHFKNEILGSKEISQENLTKIVNFLDDIQRNYRKDEFAEMFEEYLRFDEALRMTLDNFPSRLKDINELLMKFRELIATKASLLFNENLPEDWIKERQAGLEERLSQFRTELDAYERTVLREMAKDQHEPNKHSRMLLEIGYDLTKEA